MQTAAEADIRCSVSSIWDVHPDRRPNFGHCIGLPVRRGGWTVVSLWLLSVGYAFAQAPCRVVERASSCLHVALDLGIGMTVKGDIKSLFTASRGKGASSRITERKSYHR